VVCLSGSSGALCAAADFPDLPTAIQKILIKGVIRCVVTATGSNYLLSHARTFDVRSRNRAATNVLAAIVLWEAFR